ncbi:MAG: EAL domain-containing protein [Phaeospirillum sp.]|nr:EAL domain-containing protein [Phaeospirillum sp.]
MSDQNSRFLAHIRQAAKEPTGLKALHVHVSCLKPQLRTRDNLSRAITIINEANRKIPSGALFLLRNFDIVYICRNVAKSILIEMAGRLQAAFDNASPQSANAYGRCEFHTIFDIPLDGRPLIEFAEAAAGLAIQAPGGNESADSRDVDAALLGRLKTTLRNADLSSMLLSQPIYSLADAKPTPVSWEFYVSIKALEDSFCPGVKLGSRRWLFNDLTEDLDGAVLRVLTKSDQMTSRRRFSININLSVLDSETFRAFDSNLATPQRSLLTFEINKNDLIENIRTYYAIVPGLVEKGYAICVDGLDVLSLPHLDLNGLGCRYAKLFWNHDAANMNEKGTQALAERIAATGKTQFILGRCDKSESIRLARQLGIALVQGKLIDQMVKKQIAV